MRIKIAPSILSADFSVLGSEIESVERAGADLLHVDVMDGNFVPNITIGPPVIKCIRKKTKLPLDVHLMINHPDKLLGDFIKAGSDMITMHIETINAANFRLQAARLKKKGIKAGISLNPGTSLARIKGLLGFVDFVLVMSVNPGFSGQEFIPSVLSKVEKLRAVFEGDISVDGGVNDKVAGKIINAGANILAAGSYIFGAQDRKSAIERIRNASEQ